MHDPHYSHHAHAKNQSVVNVVADITCTKPVARLTIRVRLWKNGRAYKTSAQVSKAGKAYLRQNAAGPCVAKQTYRGEAWVYVKPPPGHQPPSGKTHIYGDSVKIPSCKKR
ncbi:hypothetical protein FXF65_24545 [Actinomadura syzygii]|uniref:Uncharacterized protein n=1 Tax=Actinomadura syzygii TaxID=1427538 RepID=A0A5D0U3W1_9ACTN|nr:hypothetical protein FXF65_24545 [Actinomadura syzygii]